MEKLSRISKLSSKIAVMAILSMSILAASCNSKKKAEIKYHLNLGRITFLTPSPTVTIANQEGYFEKYGLSVDIQSLGDNTAEPLSLGKIDAAFQGVIQELVMGANNEKLTFFAGTQSGGVAIGAHKDNAELLKNPENWRGKTIGSLLLRTSDIAMKDIATHQLGLKVGKDIFFKSLDDNPSIQIAIGKKSIDLGMVNPEFVELLEANGGVVIANITDYLPDNVCCRQLAYTPHFKENRETYIAFVKAQILAYRDFKLDREKSIKTLAKAYGQDDDYVITMVYDPKLNADRGYNPDPNYNGVLGLYNTLVELGHIDGNNARPLPEFFDVSVYADSLREIIAEYPNEEFYKNLWDYFVSHNNEYPEFAKNYL